MFDGSKTLAVRHSRFALQQGWRVRSTYPCIRVALRCVALRFIEVLD